MASKGNVVQTVISALGVIVAFVATLLTTPLDGSVDTLAARAIHAVPRFALGVAAGGATIFVAKLLTFLGRKIRPAFRRPATRLKALAPEIVDLYRYDKAKLVAQVKQNIFEIHHYTQRCEKLLTELSKLGIPAPPRPKSLELSVWRKFLLTLYGRAIRGNVKHARVVLKYMEAADQKIVADGGEAGSQ